MSRASVGLASLFLFMLLFLQKEERLPSQTIGSLQNAGPTTILLLEEQIIVELPEVLHQELQQITSAINLRHRHLYVLPSFTFQFFPFLLLPLPKWSCHMLLSTISPTPTPNWPTLLAPSYVPVLSWHFKKKRSCPGSYPLENQPVKNIPEPL